jgi:hypothetical protein
VGFDVTDQLLIFFLHSSDNGEKWEYSETVQTGSSHFIRVVDAQRIGPEHDLGTLQKRKTLLCMEL